MRRITRRLLVAATVIAALAVTVGAQAEPTDKVLLCHGTASAKNMYVLIEVSGNAIPQGHQPGAQGHGDKNYPDMIFRSDLYDDCEAQYDATIGGEE